MTHPSDAAPVRRAKGPLKPRRITVRSDGAVRHYSLGLAPQALAVVVVAGLAAWSAVSAVTLVSTTLERDALAERLRLLELERTNEIEAIARVEADKRIRIAAEAEAEVDALEQSRSELEAEALAARSRLSTLSVELTERQTRLFDAAENEAELSTAVAVLRAKLRDAMEARDAAVMRQTALTYEAEELRRRSEAAAASSEEWTSTIDTVTDALEETADERDQAEADRASIAEELAALQLERDRAAEARERLYVQLEDAIEAGLGGLEQALANAGFDVDRLVEDLRRDYSGAGGPFIPVDEAAAPELASQDAERVATLVEGLERASLLKVAATKIPMTMPVRAAHRFTSGFGVRRDPRNKRARMHAGVDFAAPRGTPIMATADGVVTHAGWQSGYGRVIKIRHAFGFESVYAHLNKTRVKVGERVARGQRIGDMGRSGRATGVHLHYEVRRFDKPKNPMKYIEAARHVL